MADLLGVQLPQDTAWELFDHWSAAGRVDAMHGLAPAVLARLFQWDLVGFLSHGTLW